MMEGLEHGSPGWRAMRDWAVKKRDVAQVTINAKGTSSEDTVYERGRLHLAEELIKELTPPAPDAPNEQRQRDRSGY